MTYIENSEEVLIKVEKKCQHTSARSTQTKSTNTGRTKKFVNDFFSSNGMELNENQWQSPGEIVLNECPSSTLHSLTLEAERLGKTVTYSRSLVIKISD